MEVSPREPIPQDVSNAVTQANQGHVLILTDLSVKIDVLKQAMGKSNVIAKLFDKMGITEAAKNLKSLENQYTFHEKLSTKSAGGDQNVEPATLNQSIKTLNARLAKIDDRLPQITLELADNLPNVMDSAIGVVDESAIAKQNELKNERTHLLAEKKELTGHKDALKTAFENSPPKKVLEFLRAESNSRVRQMKELEPEANRDASSPAAYAYNKLGDELRELDKEIQKFKDLDAANEASGAPKSSSLGERVIDRAGSLSEGQTERMQKAKRVVAAVLGIGTLVSSSVRQLGASLYSKVASPAMQMNSGVDSPSMQMNSGRIFMSGVPKEHEVNWAAKRQEVREGIMNDLFSTLATARNYAQKGLQGSQTPEQHTEAMNTLEKQVVELGWTDADGAKALRAKAEANAQHPPEGANKRYVNEKVGSQVMVLVGGEEPDLGKFEEGRIGVVMNQLTASLVEQRDDIEKAILEGVPDVRVNLKSVTVPQDPQIASRAFNNYGLKAKPESITYSSTPGEEHRVASFVALLPDGQEVTLENTEGQGWTAQDGMVFQNSNVQRNHDYSTSSVSPLARNIVFTDGCGQSFGSQDAAKKAADAASNQLKEGINPENVSSLRDVAQQHLTAFRVAHNAIIGTQGDTTMAQVSVVGNHAVVSWIGDCKAFVIRAGDPRRCDEISIGSRGNLTDPTDSGGRIADKSRNDDLRSLSVAALAVKPGDQIILMSDGIHDNLNPDNIGYTPEQIDPKQFAGITSWSQVDLAKGQRAVSKFMASQVLELTKDAKSLDEGIAKLQENAYSRTSGQEKISRLRDTVDKFAEGQSAEGKADNANVIAITV